MPEQWYFNLAIKTPHHLTGLIDREQKDYYFEFLNEFQDKARKLLYSKILRELSFVFSQQLCIAYTSIVSSYAFVVGIDFFLHTSLSYIVIDVILHASKPQFRRDHIVVVRPFQKNDIILSSTWIVLAIIGVIFQSVHARSKKKQFPKSGFVEQKRIRKYLMSKNKVDEKTPILINTDNNDTYGANNIC